MKLSPKKCVKVLATSGFVTLAGLTFAAEEVKADKEKCVPQTDVEFYSSTQPEAPNEWEASGWIKTIVKAGHDTGNLAAAGASIERKPTENIPIGVNTSFVVGNCKHRFSRQVVHTREKDYFNNSYATDLGGNEFSGIVTVGLAEKNQISLNVGRFDSWLGLEQGDDAIGMNATGSILYGLYQVYPDNHFGGFLNFDSLEIVKAKIFYTLGWNGTLKRENKQRAWGALARFIPDKCTKIGAAIYIGRDGANKANPDDKGPFGQIEFFYPGLTNDNMYNLYATRKLDDKWTTGIDLFYGHASCPNQGRWYGGALYALYQYCPTTKFGLGVDYVNDPDGVNADLTDPVTNKLLANHGGSVSVGVRHKLSPKQELRAEVKYIRFNHAVLPGGHKSDLQLTIANIFNLNNLRYSVSNPS